MDDDNLFPAYSDYIQGIIAPWIHHGDFLITPDKASPSISIISDGEVFGPASLRRPLSPAVLESRHPPSPSALDLRSTSLFSALIKLIPPETVRTALPAPDDKGHTPVEPGRRKLFGTPQQPAPSASRAPTSSQQLLHNLRQAAKSKSTPRRRGPPRQATHPSLRRSASATADSEVSQTAPSRIPMPSIESASKVDEGEAQGTPPLHQSSTESPVVSKSRLPRLGCLGPARIQSTALIRPGELLNQGRFAVLPVQWRQQANAQIAHMWNFASAHSDPRLKEEAFSQLAAVSAKIYKILQPRENDMRMQTQPGKQIVGQQQHSPEARNPQLSAETSAQLHTRIAKSFNGYLAAVRMCQMPPPHDPTALALVKTYPAFRRSLNQQGLQYLDTLIAEAKARGILPFASPAQHKPNVQQPPTTQQQVHPPAQHATNQHQQAVRNACYQHPPIPQQQQVPQGQRRHPALLQAQREVPVVTVSDDVRQFVNQHVPKYFEAVEYLKRSPKVCDPATREKAHIFMDQFDKALPPEGRNYLMEIMHHVAIDESAGLHD